MPSHSIPNPMNQEPLPICLDKTEEDFFDEILVGRFTRISFHRTLRIPEDGRDHPLPAGLGRFPIHRVEDYAEKVPTRWLQEGGFFIPLYQKEALFLQFEGPKWHPTIAKVCVGKINAISGQPYSETLSGQKQDYVVIPTQRWLDGICSGDGLVRQFVAMPLGQGYTVESQITDEEAFGGFQIVAFDAVSGRFPERDPDFNRQMEDSERLVLYAGSLTTRYAEVSMGIAAGGSIKQQIHKDTYGVESWDSKRKRGLTIHLVNSLAYKAITGNDPPPSPITAAAYERAKIPWYSHYDEAAPKVRPPSIFKRLLGVSEIEKRRGIAQPDDALFRLRSELNIRKIRTPDKHEASRIFRNRACESRAKEWWEAALREISYVIDLDIDVCADDFVLRSCCNFNLGRYRDGAIDGTIGLRKNQNCLDALKWRAYCRNSLGDYEHLYKDANKLIKFPETELIGLELSIVAALRLTEQDEVDLYTDAINNAIALKKMRPDYKRADELITALNMKFCGRDWEEDHGV